MGKGKKERDVSRGGWTEGRAGRRMELNPRGQRHFLRAVYRCSATFPLVIPPASVWEILQVKLQQALHFRPLQSLSTGYLSFTVQASSPLRRIKSAVKRARLWKRTGTERILSMVHFLTFACCENWLIRYKISTSNLFSFFFLLFVKCREHFFYDRLNNWIFSRSPSKCFIRWNSSGG